MDLCFDWAFGFGEVFAFIAKMNRVSKHAVEDVALVGTIMNDIRC